MPLRRGLPHTTAQLHKFLCVFLLCIGVNPTLFPVDGNNTVNLHCRVASFLKRRISYSYAVCKVLCNDWGQTLGQFIQSGSGEAVTI